MDEPLQESIPDIPAALTGSLVDGQSQLDLLNALEEDDSKDLYEPVAGLDVYFFGKIIIFTLYFHQTEIRSSYQISDSEIHDNKLFLRINL